MKTTHLIAALALSFAASGAALAQEATYEYPQAATSSVTRDQVQAELAAARADGSIKAWSISYNPLALAKSELSREVVKSQRHTGLSDAVVGEDSGSFAMSRQQPARGAAALFALGTK